jgi:hypothetical protein
MPMLKTIQGRKTLRDFTTCEDLKGIYNFFNEPTMHTYLHVDSVKYDICSDDVAKKYTMLNVGS